MLNITYKYLFEDKNGYAEPKLKLKLKDLEQYKFLSREYIKRCKPALKELNCKALIFYCNNKPLKLFWIY